MKRCPNCKRFGIEYDPYIGRERCLWKDCLWINNDNLNLDAHNYGVNFEKFCNSIEEKRDIAR